jgi:magnesium-transporting ATPase (P-type)
MPSDETSRSILTWIGWTIRKLLWTLSILSSVAAIVFVATHFYAVRGGQQQIAVAALGLFIALVPYTIARGASELGKR